MIRIEISDQNLIERIRQADAEWLSNAREKLKATRRAGKVGKGDGIWSRIKEIYILLQEFKCIYCETPMPKVSSESADKVKVAYDVEHYRPKNRVQVWPTPAVLAGRPSITTYQASVAAGAPAGYLRLAFDPFNYVVSCKVCNTSYKADRFPIFGQADSRATKRVSLDAREKPLLLFPFGGKPDDPEEFIVFDGPTISPRAAAGYERLRGQVVIDFFELDTREDLLEGRCMLVQLLWPKLQDRQSEEAAKRTRAEAFLRVVEEQLRFPHTACGRAFIRLYESDRTHAETWYEAASAYLASKDPTVFSHFC